MVSPDTPLPVDYFDGRNARPVPARLQQRDGRLQVHAPGGAPGSADTLLADVALAGLRWPERTAAGVRLLHLPDGSSVQCADAALWDDWVARHVPQRDSWVVRAQQNWPLSLGALVLLLALLGSGYLWGLPWAARHAVAWVPLAVDERIGEVALPQIERLMLTPSRTDAATREAWAQRFADVVQRAYPDGGAPRYTLLFRGSRIGPNALALPGGTIVLTDELLALAEQAGAQGQDMVLGVLAHELGHVRHRHGMQHLVSSTVLGVVGGTLIGDYSGLLAAVPLWLGQARYSRDAEREADAEARRVMHAAGLSPLAMVRFFQLAREHHRREARQRCERDLLEAAQRREQAVPPGGTGVPPADLSPCREAGADGPSLGIAIASHPPDAERIEAFRRAAQR